MLKNPGIGNTVVPTEYYLDCQAHHGLDDNCDCDPFPFNRDPMPPHHCIISCTYSSNFGDPSNIDEAATYDYISARATTFFQIILYGNPFLLGTSQFTECENDRNTCNPTNNNAGCSDGTVCP
ncbi:MAG TPA: hypothetical protein VGI61_07265 [Parafilimonas sp.]